MASGGPAAKRWKFGEREWLMQKRQIPITRPIVGDEEWQALREPLETGWLTQGPQVAAFEKAFAARHRVRHALATTSCTTALHLILASLEIQPGDEVIVPAFTWVATANVVKYCGAQPVFADIDRETYNLDIGQVEAHITPRTRAILPVHLFGLCVDMDALRELVGDIPIVEDAACAAGAECRGRPAGSQGMAAAFSFHPRKIITTGEGGMATTQDDGLAQRMNQLRNHGASVSEEQRHQGPRPYLMPEFNVLGFNYRMSDLQGAVGRVQLERLDEFLAERQRWAEFYQEQLRDLVWLRQPLVPQGFRHGWQSYVCYLDAQRAPLTRDQLLSYLEEQGVSARPGTHAVHTLGFYHATYGLHAEDCPVASDCDRQTVAIPLHNYMTPEDYAYVVHVLRALTKKV
jgi:dTDP-4-amino-4,6-dideoxygalactose transaminase